MESSILWGLLGSVSFSRREENPYIIPVRINGMSNDLLIIIFVEVQMSLAIMIEDVKWRVPVMTNKISDIFLKFSIVFMCRIEKHA